jgi:hypothetical protein
MQNNNQNQQRLQSQQNTKKASTVQVESTFQFSNINFEEPKAENVVVQPKPKPTGPWSDDLIEDKDDPSWTVVQRKRRRKRTD